MSPRSPAATSGHPVSMAARICARTRDRGRSFGRRRRRGHPNDDAWKCSLDGVTLGLEPGREHERLTEMGTVLVHREARSVCRDLEEHAAWLFEVHRLEPEAIDHRGRAGAAR